MLGNNGDVGLILSDVLMPDMTGPEMVRALPAAFHHLPILFVTGFTGDGNDQADFGGHPVLRKPYTLAALAQAVGTTLNGSRRPATAAAAE